ncbi:MAG: DUF2905 domain-containing protein [Syntrophomonadales bacterium]|jgi:hypothetical protein
MNPWESVSRLLLMGGLILLLLGGVTFLMSRSGISWRLPGDIFIQKGNFTVFFPVMTCIVISIVLTILLNVFFRR